MKIAVDVTGPAVDAAAHEIGRANKFTFLIGVRLNGQKQGKG
jgi:hypothetical protein